MSVGTAENYLAQIHAMLFGATMRLPQELHPSEAETRAVAEAYVNAAKHFPAVQIDPKYEKWIALGTLVYVAGKVYARPVLTYAAMRKLAHNTPKSNGNSSAHSAPGNPAFAAH